MSYYDTVNILCECVGEILTRKKGPEKERLVVRIPPELKEKLETKAEKYGTDMTTISVLIFRAVLDQI